eukprot:11746646-Prorocentrum_lima.AAC.1
MTSSLVGSEMCIRDRNIDSAEEGTYFRSDSLSSPAAACRMYWNIWSKTYWSKHALTDRQEVLHVCGGG